MSGIEKNLVDKCDPSGRVNLLICLRNCFLKVAKKLFINIPRLPPFWFLVAVLAQFWAVRNALVPAFGWARIIAGIVLLVTGMGFVIGAWQSFRKWQTPIMPFRMPDHCITEGLFQVSRNPIYLGEVLMLVGLAFLHGSIWALLPVPVFMAIMHYGFILPEEKVLHARFGAEFDDYRRQVRRWL